MFAVPREGGTGKFPRGQDSEVVAGSVISGRVTCGTASGDLLADLTYTVEASNNLATWSDVAVNPGTVGAAVTVTDAGAAPANAPKRYLRLKVSRE